MKRFVLALGLATALGAAPLAAEEITTDQAHAVPVRFADLDLSQPQDAAALLSRLQVATARACSASEIPRPAPSALRAIEECRAEAMDAAVARINAPELTRLHQARVQQIAYVR